jgi:sirohydrochlorin cobaltochelatase
MTARLEGLRAACQASEVIGAYHDGDPPFEAALDLLAATRVVVVPLFTSGGHYVEHVLPAALARNRRFREIALRVTLPVGGHPGVAPLLARRAAELCDRFGLDRRLTTLVVVGHGTRRVPESGATTRALVSALTRRQLTRETRPAFLDEDPPVEEILSGPRNPLLVLPFLVGHGIHAGDDLPRRLGFPAGPAALPAREEIGGRVVVLDSPFGTLPEITDLIADLYRRHLPPVRRRRLPPLVSARGRSVE